MQLGMMDRNANPAWAIDVLAAPQRSTKAEIPESTQSSWAASWIMSKVPVVLAVTSMSCFGVFAAPAQSGSSGIVQQKRHTEPESNQKQPFTPDMKEIWAQAKLELQEIGVDQGALLESAAKNLTKWLDRAETNSASDFREIEDGVDGYLS